MDNPTHYQGQATGDPHVIVRAKGLTDDEEQNDKACQMQATL